MKLTGTFTFDDLVSMASDTACEKLLEIRERGLKAEFEEWANLVADWDDIHGILSGYTVNEILGIKDEDESEDEQWNY